MKPGRELDALVAEKVMGCTVGWGYALGSISGKLDLPACFCNQTTPHSENHNLKDPRRDKPLKAVIEDVPFGKRREFREPPYFAPELKRYSTDISDALEVLNKWPYAMEVCADSNFFKATIGYKGENYTGMGDSLAHAIYLAALKAVGELDENA